MLVVKLTKIVVQGLNKKSVKNYTEHRNEITEHEFDNG